MKRHLAAFGLALAACGGAPTPPSPAVEPSSSPDRSAAAEGSAAPASAGASAAPAAEPPEEEPSLPPVELVQIEPSAPPGRMPSIAVVAPARGQIIPAKKAAGFAVKLRAAGWPLERGGNHLCAGVDRRPCKRVVDLGAPLTLAELDPTLDEGQHVLTVIARRGSGESVKPAGKGAAFASISFFVGRRTPPVWKDGGPMLVLSVPDDGPAPLEGLLLDAYVANADLATKQYRIHAAVGGPGIQTEVSVDSQKPWRLKNARPGEYLVRFSLYRYVAEGLKSSGATEVTYVARPVPGPFAEITRSLHVGAR